MSYLRNTSSVKTLNLNQEGITNIKTKSKNDYCCNYFKNNINTGRYQFNNPIKSKFFCSVAHNIQSKANFTFKP